ncbi:class I histocompatibility antigen, F10 alpha chain-like [Gastrophryne carolinensis]
MMAARSLFLVLALVTRALADSHTLRYYYTGVSDKGSGLPEFSIVGYVDDRQISNYNSEVGRERPMTEWMERNEGPEYWKGQTEISKGTEPVFRHNVRTAMSRLNHTAGIHIVQRMYGCELRDDGSTAGYNQYGYDGREFTYLDTQSWIYIPTMSEAQISTQRWNSPEVRLGERNKNYLENICIDWLKKYIEYGREDLERRVRPEVKVWGHQKDGVTTLHCLAYGFHPRAVDVKWVRNGDIDLMSLEAKTILPHPDGTYQTRTSVEVPTREGDSYSCHVDHSSMDEILAVIWEPDRGVPHYVIVIAVIAALAALAGVIAGVIVYMKKKRGYKTTSTSDTNSDSTNNPTA